MNHDARITASSLWVRLLELRCSARRYNARSRSVRAKFNSQRPGTCSLILLWTSYFVSSISAPTSGNNSVYSGVCASGVRGEGSVLEPSTWALTLAGFAGCGITVCRIRKSAALAA